MIDIGAVTHVLTTNSVCLMHLIVALKMEEFEIFLKHCIKLTKNHKKKYSIKMLFPNTYNTVCIKAINLE